MDVSVEVTVGVTDSVPLSDVVFVGVMITSFVAVNDSEKVSDTVMDSEIDSVCVWNCDSDDERLALVSDESDRDGDGKVIDAELVSVRDLVEETLADAEAVSNSVEDFDLDSRSVSDTEALCSSDDEFVEDMCDSVLDSSPDSVYAVGDDVAVTSCDCVRLADSDDVPSLEREAVADAVVVIDDMSVEVSEG